MTKLVQEWLIRRYVEADYRYLEARHGTRWWDNRYVWRKYKSRLRWKTLVRLSGAAE